MERKITISEIEGNLHIDCVGFNNFELMGIHQYCLSHLITNQHKHEKRIEVENAVIDEVVNQVETNEKIQKILKNKQK